MPHLIYYLYFVDRIKDLNAFLCQNQTLQIPDLQCTPGIINLQSVTVYTASISSVRTCDFSVPQRSLWSAENCYQTIHSELA